MEQDNLESQVNEAEVQQSKFTQVTPLSKYLAMILFILMPFIGGWIGYTYAPEKVVEVERLVYENLDEKKINDPQNDEDTLEIEKAVEVEKESELDTEYSHNTYTGDLKVGDVIAGMEVVSIEPYKTEVCVDESCKEKKDYPLNLFGNSVVTFEGRKTLEGEIVWGDGVPAARPYFNPINPEELPHGPRLSWSIAISQEVYDYYGEGNHEITVSEYKVISYPSAVDNHFEIVLPN